MKKIFLSVLFVFFSVPALAFTECTVDIKKIYAGDNGAIYVIYQNDAGFNIAPDDPNLKNALTLATSALMNGNQLVVRYKSDNVSCATGKLGDFGGLWLLKK